MSFVTATPNTRRIVLEILRCYNSAADKTLPFRDRYANWHAHQSLMQEHSLQYSRVFDIADAYGFYYCNPQPLEVVLGFNTAFLAIQSLDPFGYMAEATYKKPEPIVPINYKNLPRLRRVKSKETNNV